jgi:bifunctional non-homologous end joining protein LigD
MEQKTRVIDYVIQKHDAKRAGMHYDLRLQYPYKNSYASWALPKLRVPKTPGERSLAIRTTDHPLYWGEFSGTIPAGEKGAGTVEVVQKGRAELMAWSSNFITFKVSGPILNGKYALILFQKSPDNNKQSVRKDSDNNYKQWHKQTNWLLVKGKPDQNITQESIADICEQYEPLYILEEACILM